MPAHQPEDLTGLTFSGWNNGTSSDGYIEFKRPPQKLPDSMRNIHISKMALLAVPSRTLPLDQTARQKFQMGDWVTFHVQAGGQQAWHPVDIVTRLRATHMGRGTPSDPSMLPSGTMEDLRNSRGRLPSSMTQTASPRASIPKQQSMQDLSSQKPKKVDHRRGFGSSWTKDHFGHMHSAHGMRGTHPKFQGSLR